MIDVGSLIMSPCCTGYQAEVILIMPDPQTDEDICLLSCDNPDCVSSAAGVFTGMSCVLLEDVEEMLQLMRVPAGPLLAEVAF